MGPSHVRGDPRPATTNYTMAWSPTVALTHSFVFADNSYLAWAVVCANLGSIAEIFGRALAMLNLFPFSRACPGWAFSIGLHISKTRGLSEHA